MVFKASSFLAGCASLVLAASCGPSPSTPGSGEAFRDCADCPTMVVIPAGEFLMGSPPKEKPRRESEGPQHAVTIAKPFALGKYEVTYGQYAKFVTATGHVSGKSCVVWTGKIGGEPLTGKSWKDPNFPQGDDSPVTCITWGDGKAYAAWLSKTTGHRYDLPTEAQWEYAARAGTTGASSIPTGPGDTACKYANTSDLSAKENGGGPDWKYAQCYDGYGARTAPVGQYEPNPFGLHDMYGNVWEWIEDCWHDSYVGAPTDGSAWITEDCGTRVVRGSSLSAPPDNLRSSVRSRGGIEARMDMDIDAVPDWHNWNLGIRVMRELD